MSELSLRGDFVPTVGGRPDERGQVGEKDKVQRSLPLRPCDSNSQRPLTFLP